MDVHVGLPPHSVPGGAVHTVAGSYDYFHYKQVRVWGRRPASASICSSVAHGQTGGKRPHRNR